MMPKRPDSENDRPPNNWGSNGLGKVFRKIRSKLSLRSRDSKSGSGSDVGSSKGSTVLPTAKSRVPDTNVTPRNGSRGLPGGGTTNSAVATMSPSTRAPSVTRPEQFASTSGSSMGEGPLPLAQTSAPGTTDTRTPTPTQTTNESRPSSDTARPIATGEHNSRGGTVTPTED